MLKFIEKLRDEPTYVRQRYTLGAALLVTGLIAIIWLLSLPAQFANTEEAIPQAGEPSEESAVFQDLIDQTRMQIDRTVRSREEQNGSSEELTVPETSTSTPENTPSTPEEPAEDIIRIATSSASKSE